MRVGATEGSQHLALVGTTASGKSQLALALAQELGDVEIVSVDSMQVYRGMDVGTAKLSLDERAAVPHHLIDIADPAEEFTVARFQATATDAIAGIERRGRRALLVGGTGLYLRAVVDELDVPGQWPQVRAELEAHVEDGGPGALEALYLRLAELDPLAASRMLPTNRRRVLRALEVTLGSGRPFSGFGPGLQAYPPIRYQMVGISLSPEVVARRIEERYRAQIQAGFVDEVGRLAARPAGLSRTARQALGYRELLGHVELGVPLADAVAEAIRRTKRFSRRQRVWFRRDPRISWYTPESDAVNPLAAVPAILGKWVQCRPSA
ncbi:MAG TPA: tRNA (adenosine(37)-N6)-dimethylallyltransferase MiaA [Acidimicrobiales bacterium]|nr:tRNA (adenosine(37)-N6)-dimethylallyltransferase MiaA [Acidimicrobiales bacterium]